MVLAIGTGVLLFLFTRDRKYLRFSFRLLQYSVFAALAVLLLLALERATKLF